MNRRGFLTGIIAACAAPAIVRSGLIMPIKPALAYPLYFDAERCNSMLDEIALNVMRQNAEANALLMRDFITHGVCAYRQFGAVLHRIDPQRLMAIDNKEGIKIVRVPKLMGDKA